MDPVSPSHSPSGEWRPWRPLRGRDAACRSHSPACAMVPVALMPLVGTARGAWPQSPGFGERVSDLGERRPCQRLTGPLVGPQGDTCGPVPAAGVRGRRGMRDRARVALLWPAWPPGGRLRPHSREGSPRRPRCTGPGSWPHGTHAPAPRGPLGSSHVSHLMARSLGRTAGCGRPQEVACRPARIHNDRSQFPKTRISTLYCLPPTPYTHVPTTYWFCFSGTTQSHFHVFGAPEVFAASRRQESSEGG